MTEQQFRDSDLYAEYMKKIEGYPEGFEFTLPYHKMKQATLNAINVLMRDAVKAGLVISVAIGESYDSLFQTHPYEETFRRI